MSFSLAIVGRPNVGKSTLFNRLVGKRLALVDDQPGVTRDLREGEARLADLRFTVIDTAGLEEVTDDSLQGRMRRLTERAVDMADICLFMIDARVGVTQTDEMFADILRKRAKHVILGANKGEGSAADAGVLEAWALGLGEPLRLSAEHGEGMTDLLRCLMPLADDFKERAQDMAFRIAFFVISENTMRLVASGFNFNVSARCHDMASPSRSSSVASQAISALLAACFSSLTSCFLSSDTT